MKGALLPEGRMRRAAGGDAAALALLGGATFLQAFAVDHPGEAIVAHVAEQHSVEYYAAALADPAVEIWLVETPLGAPIAYAMLAAAADGAGCELKRLYVLGLWQGSGWGERLLKTAEAAARARGATSLTLMVYGENHAAQRFYLRHGFADTGRRVDFFVGPRPFVDWVLAKPL